MVSDARCVAAVFIWDWTRERGTQMLDHKEKLFLEVTTAVTRVNTQKRPRRFLPMEGTNKLIRKKYDMWIPMQTRATSSCSRVGTIFDATEMIWEEMWIRQRNGNLFGVIPLFLSKASSPIRNRALQETPRVGQSHDECASLKSNKASS